MKKGGLPPFSSLFPGLFFHFFAFFDSLKAGHTPGFFLYVENHSLGEWFKRRLMSIMGKEKLPFLYWKCGLRTTQASKGRTFENERRK